MKVLHRRMGARVWCLVLLAALACCAPAVARGAAHKGLVFDVIDMYNYKYDFISAFGFTVSENIEIDVSLETILNNMYGASINLTTDGQECNIAGKSNNRYVVRASNTSTTLSRDAAVGTITVGRGLDGTRVTAQEGSELGLLRCVSPTAVANAPGAIRYAVVMAEGSGTTFDAMPGMLVVSPGALVVVEGVTYDNTGGTEDMVLPQAQAPDAGEGDAGGDGTGTSTGTGDTAPADTTVVHTRPVILGPSVIYLTVGYEAHTVTYRVLGAQGPIPLPEGIPGLVWTSLGGGAFEFTIPAGLPPGEYGFSLFGVAYNDSSYITDRLDVTVVVSDIERINGQTAYTETITLPWGYAEPIQRANHVTGAPIASLTLDAGGTGATLDAAGTLTIPTGLGAGTYTVRLATRSATATYTIVVTPGTPLIDGQQAVEEDITVDIGYSAPITRAYMVGGGAGVDTVTNTAGAAVALTGGRLSVSIPVGLDKGSYQLVAEATNESVDKASLTINLTVRAEAPTINEETAGTETITLSSGYVAHTQTLRVSGFEPPTLTITQNGSGAGVSGEGVLTIPAGLGVGTYTEIVTATNSQGSATRTFTIQVMPVAPLLDGLAAITETIEVDVGYAQAISRSYAVTGHPTPTLTLDAGGTGATFDQSGNISIPTGLTGDEYTLVLTARNAAAEAATVTLTLRVRAEAPAINGATSGTETITLSSGYAAPTQTLRVSGFEAPTLTITQNGSGAGVSGEGVLTIPAGLDVGTYTEIVTATNSQGSATRTFTIQVTPVAPLLDGQAAITDTIEVDVGYPQGIARSYAVTGHPIPTLTLDAGGTGATFDQSGNISIPTGLTGDEYTLVLTARNAAAEAATVTLTLRVRAEAPAFNGMTDRTDSITLTEGNTGYQRTYFTTGVPTPTVQCTSSEIAGAQVSTVGTLIIPAGVQSGSYKIVLTAANDVGTATVTVTVTVKKNQLVLSTTSIPEWTVGVDNYAEQLSATGGSGSYTYSGAAGLPAGLSLSAGGMISGTPAEAGTFNVSVTVTDVNQPDNSATGTVSLTINPRPTADSQYGYGTVGEPFFYTISCYGGTGVMTVALDNGLPAGLTFSGNTISGTPTQDGILEAIPITVTDSLGAMGTGTLTLVILPPSDTTEMTLMLSVENDLFAPPPPEENETDTGEPVEDGQLPGDGGDSGSADGDEGGNVGDGGADGDGDGNVGGDGDGGDGNEGIDNEGGNTANGDRTHACT